MSGQTPLPSPPATAGLPVVGGNASSLLSRLAALLSGEGADHPVLPTPVPAPALSSFTESPDHQLHAPDVFPLYVYLTDTAIVQDTTTTQSFSLRGDTHFVRNVRGRAGAKLANFENTPAGPRYYVEIEIMPQAALAGSFWFTAAIIPGLATAPTDWRALRQRPGAIHVVSFSGAGGPITGTGTAAQQSQGTFTSGAQVHRLYLPPMSSPVLYPSLYSQLEWTIGWQFGLNRSIGNTAGVNIGIKADLALTGTGYGVF